MSDTVVKVEHLSKQYKLGYIGTGTLSHDLNRMWHKIRGKDDPYLKIGEANDRSAKGTSDYVWSLRDINFEIEQGDAVGIIGRNGAGKSTLLKILSKVTQPTTGTIKTKGRIASLLEVGTGFHPELSGRDNIFLNGAIMGMRKEEIKRKLDAIVDFSGVERYIDTPVKRYSSGMYVRLAFAVAAHLESEILIVDEVLAVGDAEFQKKCLGKMGEVSRGEGRTVLFVSHNMMAVQTLCVKGIVLKNGAIDFQGKTETAVARYLHENSNPGMLLSEKPRYGNAAIQFTSVQLQDLEGNIIGSVESGKDFKVCLSYTVNDPGHDFKGIQISLNIMDHYGMAIYNHHNLLVNKLFGGSDLIAGNMFVVTIRKIPLAEGNYMVGINMFQEFSAIDVVENAFDIDVVGSDAFNYKNAPNPRHGIVLMDTDWEIK